MRRLAFVALLSLAALLAAARNDLLESLGLTESDLDRPAHAAYRLLGLQNYFTAGGKEVRAWTIHPGGRAEGKEYVVQDGDMMLFRFNN